MPQGMIDQHDGQHGFGDGCCTHPHTRIMTSLGDHLDGLALDEVRKDDKLKTYLTKLTAIRCEAGKVIAEYLP